MSQNKENSLRGKIKEPYDRKILVIEESSMHVCIAF